MKNFTSDSQKIGKLGEDIACKFLLKHGFSILERNYTRKWGEIDIVATRDNKYYFIEVKSKSVRDIENLKVGFGNMEEMGRPEDNMHPWKLKRLSRVIQTYLISKRIGNIEWQLDLLIVYIDILKRIARVRKIEGIVI